MKKLLLAFAVLPVLTTVNAQTKKVLIEDFTGVKCQWCPEGTVVIEDLEHDNPTNCLGLAVHSGQYTPAGSPVKTAEGDAVEAACNPGGGWPAGAVDRKKYGSNTKLAMSRGSWGAAFGTQSAITPIVSVGFGNARRTTDSTYEADVTVKFTSAPVSGNPLKVQVYIVEDKIEAKSYGSGAMDLRQINAAGSSVKGGENPLTNWFHNNVLRKALGGSWGFNDVIPATGPVVGTTYSKKITFTAKGGATPTGWVKDNLKVYAFVAYDGAAADDKKEILNIEELSIKGFFPTGVNDVKENVSIIGAYPNPALSSDLVKVEYNIKESSKVTMKVFNAIGQVVAQPYNSDEVEGAHTIHWRPSETGVSAGMYMIQVSTDKGASMVQRVTIQ